MIREADGQLEMMGSLQELRDFASAIANLTGKPHRFVADSSFDPHPYDRTLAAVNVIPSDGPVRLSIAGDIAEVRGNSEMLQTFSSFFLFPDDAAAGAHHHHEWYEGNQYVAPDSLPLIIAVA